MADTFQKYGPNFQLKLLAQVIKYPKFLNQISDILKSDFFDSEANQHIASIALEYNNKTKHSPTAEVLSLEVKKSSDSDLLKISIIENLKKIYQYMEETDDGYIQEESLLFCKNQRVKAAMLESVKHLKEGNYDAIRTTLSDALNAGIDVDYGLDYNRDFEIRYDETHRKCITTPWEQINELTQGGLGAGELGVVAGPPGSGKSWALTDIGAHALKQGKNVLHYTLELNRNYTGLRYDAYITGYNFQDLKYHKEDVKRVLDEHKLGKLIIKHYPPSRINTNTIFSHTKQVEGIGFYPDLIIVDHLDNMLPIREYRNTSDKYESLGAVCEELRALADDLEIPLWSASQGNRSSENEEYLSGRHLSDSYKKLMVADFVMGWQRRMEDKANDTGMISIIKNRFGPDGLLYPADTNMSNGRIVLHDTSTEIGKKKQSDRKNNEVTTKKLLKNSLKEIGIDLDN